MGVRQLSELVQMDSHEAVLDEVHIILDLISPGPDIGRVTSAFILAVNLYNGIYPGYQACNTEYHDLHHTIDVFLAMARIIHGATLNNIHFTERQIFLALIAALLHDVGYIQEEHDKQGTGSKYTDCHVQRSMDFVEKYGDQNGFSEEEISSLKVIILCTDITIDISTIDFPSAKIKNLGKMLAVVDLLAQMADRIYLEKLLFLYHEYREANFGDYQSELDLLHKTIKFYDFV